MKLYYRGLSYEYDQSKVNGKKTEHPFTPVRQQGPAYNLMYRGVTYCVDPNSQSAEVSLPTVAYKLNFRGINYFVNKTAQGEVSVVSQPVNTSKVETLLISEKLELQQ